MISEIKKLIKSSDISKECISLLMHYNKTIVAEHTKRVAIKSIAIAHNFSLNINELNTAAYLHDISVIIEREKYAEICRKYNITTLEVERNLPILLHQKVSCIIAQEIFNIEDEDILSAISCHTTLKANPSKCDMILFIADKLEWDQGGYPPYKNIIEDALSHSLEKACLEYINYVIANKMILIPHPDLLSAKNYLENKILYPST